MKKVVIIRYCEIHLKGKNRSYFERMLGDNIRHALKDEDFEKAITEKANTLSADVNKSAIAPFKVKNIVEPEYSYQ